MKTLIIVAQMALLILSFIILGIHMIGMLINTNTFIGFLSSVFIIALWIASASILFYQLKEIEKEL